MSDYIIRATAADGMIRAFACDTRDTVEQARINHHTSPVVTAALGRLLSAGLMMGSMMKNKEDRLTLKIEGSGPLAGAIVTSDCMGHVKGYPFNSNVDIPLNSQNKLDVAEAIGVGILTVIADTGMKEPYSSQLELISGEIAEDITYYYATSEQTPSSVALGVLIDRDNTVISAGGFIIQLMPDCSDEIIEKLEKNIGSIQPITTMLDSGLRPEDILEKILGDFNLEINDRIDAKFYCNCSKKKIEKALISIGKSELQNMMDKDEDIEVCCHFCNKAYNISIDEIKSLAERS